MRWQWTHKYGVSLLIASIVAVVLSGSGLITVVVLSGGNEVDPRPPEESTDPTTVPETTNPPPEPPPPPPPPPSASPTAALDPECVVGTWQAVALEDVSITGTWTLVGGGPVLTYRDDRTGVIDYDPDGGEGTTFEFEDIFGQRSNNSPTGEREFQYSVDQSGSTIRHIYQDLFGGAQMLGIPYIPNEDTFATTCEGDAMVLDGEDGYFELARVAS